MSSVPPLKTQQSLKHQKTMQDTNTPQKSPNPETKQHQESQQQQNSPSSNKKDQKTQQQQQQKQQKNQNNRSQQKKTLINNELYPYAESLKIPIYSPRTTYKKIRQNDEKLLQELMLKLEPFTVQVIANDFEKAGGEVKVAEFIILMKEHLKDWQRDIPNREYKLIRTLANLFDQIDLNINELLDWEELANYVLGKATVIDNIKTKNQVVRYYTKTPNFTINHKFYNPIQKIIYIDHIDRLAFFQRGTDTIMIAGNDGVLNQKQLKVQPKDINIDVMNIKKDNDYNLTLEKKELTINRRTIIIDVIYISDYSLLMVSSNDGYIRGYRFVSNGFVPATFPKSEEFIEKEIQKTNVNCMSWDTVKKLLYCGLNNGNVLVWCLGGEYEEQQHELNKNRQQNAQQNPNNNTNNTNNNNTQKKTDFYLEKGHKLTVQDIIPMAKLQYVATGGLDGVIVLWDTITHTKKREYKEHQRGIVSLAFNPQTILLFSAGFDHWIGVWNPYTDHLIYCIDGHSCPILSLKINCKHKQLISLDQDGNVQIRDLNKFYINQTLQIEQPDEKNKFEAQDFCFTPSPLRLYFVGHSMQQYQYDINYNPSLTDEKLALTCISIPKQFTLYTPCGNKVKIWSLLTGEILRIFMGLTHQGADISAFILDKLKKRMLIGDTEGYISILNAENGAKIKNLPRHSADVILIMECQEAGLFVTASINNQIHLTLDNDFGENELLRVISLKDQLISKITFYPESKLVIVGTNVGQIAFFEAESGKLHGSSQSARYNETITHLSPFPSIPFLLATTSTGKINFIATPPLLYKYQIVDSFTNFDNEETKEPLGIINAVFSAEEDLLFITDDKYMLKAYNIAPICENIRQNVKEGMNMNKHELYSYYSTLKSFTGAKGEEGCENLWCVKAHSEQVNAMTYDEKHRLVMTCSLDKKVKIWSSEKGVYLASLVQSLDVEKPRELAYRKKFTQEIYDPEGELFEKRIDTFSDLEKNSQIENLQQQQGDLNNKSVQNLKSNQKKKGNSQQGDEYEEIDEQLEQESDDLDDDDDQDEEIEFDHNYYVEEEIENDEDEEEEGEGEEDSQDQDAEIEEQIVNEGENEENKNQNEQGSKITEEGQEEESNQQTVSKSSKHNEKSGQSQHNSVQQSSQQSKSHDKIFSTSNQSASQNKHNRNKSKMQYNISAMNQYKEQVEDVTIEAEFDPFFYINKMDPKKKQGPFISNNEWKLFVDYKTIIEEQNLNLKHLEEQIQKILKNNKQMEFKEKVFPITNFEVNPNLFDPNNQFRPYIQTKFEKDDSLNFADAGLSKQAIANKVKKQQQKEKGKDLMSKAHINQKQKQVSEDTWNNLYRYKKNYRNMDPNKFKQKIQHSKKISNLTKEKVDLLLNKLEAYDNMTFSKRTSLAYPTNPALSSMQMSNTLKQSTDPVFAYDEVNDDAYGSGENTEKKIKNLIKDAFSNKMTTKEFDNQYIYNKITSQQEDSDFYYTSK